MKIQIILDFDTDRTREQFDRMALDLQNELTSKGIGLHMGQITKMQTQLINQIITPTKGFRQ